MKIIIYKNYYLQKLIILASCLAELSTYVVYEVELDLKIVNIRYYSVSSNI